MSTAQLQCEEFTVKNAEQATPSGTPGAWRKCAKKSILKSGVTFDSKNQILTLRSSPLRVRLGRASLRCAFVLVLMTNKANEKQ